MIDEAVSTHDLQEASVKKNAVEDECLQASVSAGDTQQSNSEADKEDTKKTVSRKLTRGMNYALSVLLGMGYSFGRIRINRDIDQKQVKKKITSILACNGTISPFLVVPAIVCLKAGLELEDSDGNSITEETPDLDLILIVIDGQHRMEALRQLNKKLRKEGKAEYEGYVYLPLINDYDVPTLLREANSATTPWDGMDWLTQLLATAQEKGISTKKLEWVKEKAKSGSDSAAWSWVNGGKTNSKTTCIKASTNTQKLEELADVTSFEEDKRLYEAAAKSFEGNSAKVLGWKVLPEWVYRQLDSLIKKDMKRSEAMSLLITFLEGLGTSNAQEISQMKKSSNQSKDNMIIAKLNELFADFQSQM
ncbi:hypothetical protein [Bacteroides gallinarum]|uniref:hypothetical protein n=2 Tax=Bacteroides gallinarum TaxID=376806 RepID=UPI000377DFC9|nr:hypothetical protein [Bacteroides gallinarum]